MLGRTQKLICVLQRSEYFLNKQFKNVKKYFSMIHCINTNKISTNIELPRIQKKFLN